MARRHGAPHCSPHILPRVEFLVGQPLDRGLVLAVVGFLFRFRLLAVGADRLELRVHRRRRKNDQSRRCRQRDPECRRDPSHLLAPSARAGVSAIICRDCGGVQAASPHRLQQRSGTLLAQCRRHAGPAVQRPARRSASLTARKAACRRSPRIWVIRPDPCRAADPFAPAAAEAAAAAAAPSAAAAAEAALPLVEAAVAAALPSAEPAVEAALLWAALEAAAVVPPS